MQNSKIHIIVYYYFITVYYYSKIIVDVVPFKIVPLFIITPPSLITFVDF